MSLSDPSKTEVVLRMEVGLDPRMGGTVSEQVEALSVIEAIKVEDAWYLPTRKGLMVEDLYRDGLPAPYPAPSNPGWRLYPCSFDYASMLDASPSMGDSDAVMMLDPIEATKILQKTWIELEKSRPFPDHSRDLGTVADIIGSALEEWGLLPPMA